MMMPVREEEKAKPRREPATMRATPDVDDAAQRDEVAEGAVQEACDAEDDAGDGGDEAGGVAGADVGGDAQVDEVEALEGDGAERVDAEEGQEDARGRGLSAACVVAALRVGDEAVAPARITWEGMVVTRQEGAAGRVETRYRRLRTANSSP